MKSSIKDFFRKCDQIRRKLRIWWHLLKKSLMEYFIFCALDPVNVRFISSNMFDNAVTKDYHSLRLLWSFIFLHCSVELIVTELHRQFLFFVFFSWTDAQKLNTTLTFFTNFISWFAIYICDYKCFYNLSYHLSFYQFWTLYCCLQLVMQLLWLI